MPDFWHGRLLLKLPGRARVYSESQLKEILGHLVELEKLATAISRRGVRFSTYLSHMDKKTKKLPVFAVKVEGKTHFLHNDEELAALKADEDVNVTEFFEAREVGAVLKALREAGLEATAYEAPEVRPKKALCIVVDGKKEPLHNY